MSLYCITTLLTILSSEQSFLDIIKNGNKLFHCRALQVLFVYGHFRQGENFFLYFLNMKYRHIQLQLSQERKLNSIFHYDSAAISTDVSHMHINVPKFSLLGIPLAAPCDAQDPSLPLLHAVLSACSRIIAVSTLETFFFNIWIKQLSCVVQKEH